MSTMTSAAMDLFSAPSAHDRSASQRCERRGQRAPLGATVQLRDAQGVAHATACDISEHGMQLRTSSNSSLPVGSEVTVFLQLPWLGGLNHRLHLASAEVVWDGGPEGSDLEGRRGLRFSGAGSELRQAIREYFAIERAND